MESNHVRDLMEAYSSIYAENEEVEQLDEFAPRLQGPVNKVLKGGQEFLKGLGLKVNEKERPTPDQNAQREKINQNQNQSFDLFDIIKGHLLDEGFADTEEAALAIMTNMSEEWREQILDEAVRGSGRSIGDIITGDDIRGVTRGKKPVYKKPKWKDDVENKVDREVQLLSDRKNKKKSEMAAGRLTVATKRGIEKATNRSNDGPGGDEFAPGSALRRREEDDQPTDYRARKRRASGR